MAAPSARPMSVLPKDLVSLTMFDRLQLLTNLCGSRLTATERTEIDQSIVSVLQSLLPQFTRVELGCYLRVCNISVTDGTATGLIRSASSLKELEQIAALRDQILHNKEGRFRGRVIEVWSAFATLDEKIKKWKIQQNHCTSFFDKLFNKASVASVFEIKEQFQEEISSLLSRNVTKEAVCEFLTSRGCSRSDADALVILKSDKTVTL
jgi:hypothetical protein